MKRNYIFDKLFPEGDVEPLGEFLLRDSAFALSEGQLFGADDDSDYTKLLKLTLVAYTPYQDRAAFSYHPSPSSSSSSSSSSSFVPARRSSMPDLVQHVRNRLARLNIQSVIGLGCRQRRSEGDQEMLDSEFLTNYDSNTTALLLQSRPWCELLSRTSDALMIHLLFYCCMFTPLPNNCFLQISGTPLQVLCYRSRSYRKYAMQTASAEKPCLENAKNNLLIKRTPMYFASGAWAVRGLPKSHVLNEVAALDTVEAAEKIILRIFRVNGKSSLMRMSWRWKSDKVNNAWIPLKRSKCNSSENEPVAIKTLEVPKLLSPLIKVMTKFVGNHRKCPYLAYLDKLCPNPMKDLDAEKKITPDDTQGVTDLMTLRSSQKDVKKWVNAVVFRVLPCDLLGSRGNLEQFLRHCARVVDMNRMEQLTMHQVLQGMKTKDIPWLRHARGRHVPQGWVVNTLSGVLDWLLREWIVPLLTCNFYVTDTEPFKHQTVYYRRELWRKISKSAMMQLGSSAIFDKLNVDIAHAIFSAHDRKLGYASLRLKPKASGFRPVVNMAKSTKVRMKAQNNHDKECRFLPINRVMRAPFHVMREHQYSVPKLLGSSTTGYAAIYRKFIRFIRAWKRAPGEGQSLLAEHGRAASMSQPVPSLFMVTIDIRRCFDNINRDVLLQLVEDILREDAYILEAYNQAKLQMGDVYLQHKQLVYPANNVPAFPGVIEDKAEQSKNLIFCDKVTRRNLSREDLMAYFRQHILENVVQLDGQYYIQKKGVPQGSVLSSLLTCIFLGHVEKKYLKPRLRKSLKRSSSNRNHQYKEPDYADMMLRHVDDFIFVSTHKESVNSFIQTMSEGMPELGIDVNVKKTKTNFDATANGSKLRNIKDEVGKTKGMLGLMPWNGLLIHPDTLEVCADYTRYCDSRMIDSINANTFQTPGQKLSVALKRCCQEKAHPLLLDRNINSIFTIGLNVFQMMTMAAIRMLATLRRIAFHPANRKRAKTIHNQPFLVKIISECIEYFHTIVIKRFEVVNQQDSEEAEVKATSSKRSKNNDGKAHAAPSVAQTIRVHPKATFGLSRAQASFLSYLAFKTAFQRKQALYTEVCSALTNKLNHHHLACEVASQLSPSPATSNELAAFRTELVEVLRLVPRILATPTTVRLYSIKF